MRYGDARVMTQPSLFSRVPTPRAARAQRDQALAKVDPAWVRLAAAHVTSWAWQAHGDRTPWLLVLDAGLRQIEARQRGAAKTNAKLYGTPERRAAAGQRLLAARLAKRGMA